MKLRVNKGKFSRGSDFFLVADEDDYFVGDKYFPVIYDEVEYWKDRPCDEYVPDEVESWLKLDETK